MERNEMTHDGLFDEIDRLEEQTSDMEIEIKDLETENEDYREDIKRLINERDEIYDFAKDIEGFASEIMKLT